MAVTGGRISGTCKVCGKEMEVEKYIRITPPIIFSDPFPIQLPPPGVYICPHCKSKVKVVEAEDGSIAFIQYEETLMDKLKSNLPLIFPL